MMFAVSLVAFVMHSSCPDIWCPTCRQRIEWHRTSCLKLDQLVHIIGPRAQNRKFNSSIPSKHVWDVVKLIVSVCLGTPFFAGVSKCMRFF